MSWPAYPEYKDSGILWLDGIPCHWSTDRLKYLVCIIPSNVDKHSNPDEIPVFLCNYTDVYYRDRITSDLDFMRATVSADELERFRLCAGDVIITKDSETADDIAVPAYVPEALDSVVCGYHLSIVRPARNAFGRFLYYWFLSRQSRAYFEVSAKGLTRVGLSQGVLGGAYIAAPPPTEQARIAQFLDHETARIDALIEEQQRLIDLLQEKRQAVISHAVAKGIDPDVPMKYSGIEWLGSIPEHWNCKQFRYACKIYRGKFSHRPRNDPSLYDGSYPFIQTGDVARAKGRITDYIQTLNEQGVKVSQRFPSGTLVMAIAANIGDTAVLDFEAYAPDSIVGFNPGNDIDLKYLDYVFEASMSELERVSTQNTQSNLNIDRIGSVHAAFPPMEEQKRIVDYLDGMLERHDRLFQEMQHGIELMKEHRSALISAAVTGKIDVRGWKPQDTPVEHDLPRASEAEAQYG